MHEVPIGEVWPLEAILDRKRLIEAAGLTWSVVESIPVHEAIKHGKPSKAERQKYIDNYKTSVENIGKAGTEFTTFPLHPKVRVFLYNNLSSKHIKIV